MRGGARANHGDTTFRNLDVMDQTRQVWRYLRGTKRDLDLIRSSDCEEPTGGPPQRQLQTTGSSARLAWPEPRGCLLRVIRSGPRREIAGPLPTQHAPLAPPIFYLIRLMARARGPGKPMALFNVIRAEVFTLRLHSPAGLFFCQAVWCVCLSAQWHSPQSGQEPHRASKSREAVHSDKREVPMRAEVIDDLHAKHLGQVALVCGVLNG